MNSRIHSRQTDGGGGHQTDGRRRSDRIVKVKREKRGPLTEQDEDAEQDGHQRPRAEPRGAAQSLGVAHLHISLSVARAHPNRERARAALHGNVSVRDHHSH